MQVPPGWVTSGEPVKKLKPPLLVAPEGPPAACGRAERGLALALSGVPEGKMLAFVPVLSAVTLKPTSNRSGSGKHPLQQTKAAEDGGSESLDNEFTRNTVTALFFSAVVLQFLLTFRDTE